MHRRIKLAAIFMVSFGVLLGYQNCGVDPIGSYFDKSTSFPMPYETKIDQIAYMSCSEQQNVPNDAGVYFTFRVGAYGGGAGIRLNDNFLYETRKMKNQNRMDILADDAGTALSKLQFAIRQQAALHRMFTNEDSGDGVEEIDFDFVLGDLGSEDMSATLLKMPSGEYLNYLPAAGITRDAYMEGTMVFNTSEVLAEQVRQQLTGQGIIALTYAEPNDPSSIRTPDMYSDDADEDGIPDDEDEDVPISTNVGLGVGLKVSFRQPNPLNWYTTGTPQVSVPKRVLASVKEYNLMSPNSSGPAWDCPTTMQFRIIFPEDANDDDPGTPAADNICPVAEDPASPSDELKIIRRSLPASDWYVNLTKRCVVAKKYTVGSCYGVDQGTQDTRTPLYWFTNVNTTKCNPAISLTCPHFVSICFKTVQN